LHRHHRAVAAVDPLDLACDQSVGDIAEPGAAEVGRDRRPEKAELAHLAKDRRVRRLLAKRLQHARRELVPGVSVRGLLDHALFFRELRFEIERIGPVEAHFVHEWFLRRRSAPSRKYSARGGVNRLYRRSAVAGGSPSRPDGLDVIDLFQMTTFPF
jgi:hypothetical protein